MTLRPSGTEPKIKFYFSLSDYNSEENKKKLLDLIDKEVVKIKKNYE